MRCEQLPVSIYTWYTEVEKRLRSLRSHDDSGSGPLGRGVLGSRGQKPGQLLQQSEPAITSLGYGG